MSTYSPNIVSIILSFKDDPRRYNLHRKLNTGGTPPSGASDLNNILISQFSSSPHVLHPGEDKCHKISRNRGAQFCGICPSGVTDTFLLRPPLVPEAIL